MYIYTFDILNGKFAADDASANQSTRTLKVLQLTTNVPATVPGCSAYLHNSLEVA